MGEIVDPARRKLRPSVGTSSAHALAIAAISIADLVPSRNELNICGFMPAALRREPTGQASAFRGDVVAVSKRALSAGETLDGEGGYTVWGKLVPAARSLAEGALPIGLAHKVPLVRCVPAGRAVHWSDVAVPDSKAVRARRDMELRFTPSPAALAAQ